MIRRSSWSLALAGALLAAGPVHAEGEERDLDGMAVIGSQELPKALYIVPWQGAEIGEAAPSSSHGLSDDPLRPLDRGVFERELHYHDTLNTER